MSDRLETRLRELAGDLRVPEPGPGLAGAVVARVAKPRRHRLRWAVVAAVVLALLGLAVSPVGAKVTGWLDVGGVMVRDDDTVPTGTPVVPSESGRSLDGAAFEPLVPAALGPPDGVRVTDDGTLVSMSWSAGGRTIRLDQFAAGLDPYFWKSAPGAEPVTVAGRDALWFAVPHEVTVVPEGGQPETYAPRLSAQTLVLPLPGVTLRLEGDLSRRRAVEILASLE
ncbi:hypothetical protein [Nocardioides aquiterrae]|uniref:DUF4367 domain-containing protein n=1 Tax=Nocardioides aquiterrae TaxID=203799 RepID=A0ABN1UIP6_9ACTN